jgi:hypothetical protein
MSRGQAPGVGLGLLTWFICNEAESRAGRGIASALLVAYLVALVVSVRGQLDGALNALGWMPVAIQAFFVASFGSWLLTERRVAVPAVRRAQ